MRIFSNTLLYIEQEPSQVPWLKVFTHTPYKELSECDTQTKLQLFETLDIIEKTMLQYYNPTKINIASFGNYLPKLHFHIMARFEDDCCFPEPMWGKKTKEEKNLNLPSFENFTKLLLSKL